MFHGVAIFGYSGLSGIPSDPLQLTKALRPLRSAPVPPAVTPHLFGSPCGTRFLASLLLSYSRMLPGREILYAGLGRSVPD